MGVQRAGHDLATKQQSSQSSGLLHTFVTQFVSLLVAKSQTQPKRLTHTQVYYIHNPFSEVLYFAETISHLTFMSG